MSADKVVMQFILALCDVKIKSILPVVVNQELVFLITLIS